MFKLKSYKNQKFNEINFVEVLFYSFPLCFIVGNLIVSINTLLFICVSLYVIKKKHLNFRFNRFYWILIIFYLYFFISTTYQYQIPGLLNDKIQNFSLENNPIFKSFLFIRFIILIFIIDVLIYNNIIKLEKLFLSSLICTSFVCFDLMLQYITGSDLFGYKNIEQWHSGPFGDEMIAGTFLKNFSFLSFFYIFNNFNKSKSNLIFSIFFITIHLSAALITSNRMPLLLFLFGCIIILVFVKNLRLIMSSGLLLFFIIFTLLIKFDSNLSTTYEKFIDDINIVKLFKNNQSKSIQTSVEKSTSDKNKIEKKEPEKNDFLKYSGYNRVFNTAIEMWKLHPVFGGGHKSFRIKCWKILSDDLDKIGARFDPKRPQKLSCGNHPHNYYLEFLAETGIVGTFLLVAFFFFIIKNSLSYLIKNKKKINFILPIFIIFFIEIWPLRSSGSFFTTWGATFFWINTAILMSYTVKKKLLKKST